MKEDGEGVRVSLVHVVEEFKANNRGVFKVLLSLVPKQAKFSIVPTLDGVYALLKKVFFPLDFPVPKEVFVGGRERSNVGGAAAPPSSRLRS